MVKIRDLRFLRLGTYRFCVNPLLGEWYAEDKFDTFFGLTETSEQYLFFADGTMEWQYIETGGVCQRQVYVYRFFKGVLYLRKRGQSREVTARFQLYHDNTLELRFCDMTEPIVLSKRIKYL